MVTNVTGFQRRRRVLAAKQTAAEEAAKQTVENKPIEEMTVAELKQYAADNGIDLSGATKKAEILTAIQSAQNDGGGMNEDGTPKGGNIDAENDGDDQTRGSEQGGINYVGE